MELKQTTEKYQKLIQELAKDNDVSKLTSVQDGKTVRILMEQGAS